MAGMFHRLADDVDLHIGGDGNIDDFHARIGQQRLIIGMHRFDARGGGRRPPRVEAFATRCATGRKPAAR